jgi:hypothetical protein
MTAAAAEEVGGDTTGGAGPKLGLRRLAALLALVTLASLACRGSDARPADSGAVVPVSRPEARAEIPATPVAETRQGSTSATALPDPAASPQSPAPGRPRGFSRFVPLDNPVFLTVEEATYLADDDLVLGLEWQGAARAYPIRMVTFHHVVNDIIGGTPLLITY